MRAMTPYVVRREEVEDELGHTTVHYGTPLPAPQLVYPTERPGHWSPPSLGDSSADLRREPTVDTGEKPRASGSKRGRQARPLYRAEQVMEDKKMPKKKYLAMQRLRRDMERSSVESLHLDVNSLKQQIADLSTMKDIIQGQWLSIRATQTACRKAIVHEYFTVIEYGLGREGKGSPWTLNKKIDFLKTMMDDQLQFGLASGLDAFIDQCRYYTLFHAAFRYLKPHLSELEVSPELTVVVARNRLRVRVSRTTIEQIFPHVLGDEVFVQMLIGRELVYPCEIRLYFDKNGKVVRHDASVDFVTGLNAALRSLKRVANMMNHALISHGAVIVSDRRQAAPPQVEIIEDDHVDSRAKCQVTIEPVEFAEPAAEPSPSTATGSLKIMSIDHILS